VSIETSYGLDGLGFETWQGQEIFSLLELSSPALDATQLPTQMSTLVLSWRKMAGA
jgi:hypothetical protein